MKSRLLDIIHLVRHGVFPSLILFSLTVASASMPARASDEWQVEPQSSIARLSLGSSPNTLEIGLARVSGNVVFESSDPADPSVSLKMVPVDEAGADCAELSFTSERSGMASDGRLMVTGELTVTRTERSVTMEATEDYAGPQYGRAIAHTDTRQITLTFSRPHDFVSPSGVMDFIGSVSVSGEDFPMLLGALTRDAWPTMLVNDENCEQPSTIGEDYTGAKCTGVEIASVSNRMIPTGVSGGEGYSGFESVVIPNRNDATITFDLKLNERAGRIAQNAR